MKSAKKEILVIAAALFLVLAGSAGTAWYAKAASDPVPVETPSQSYGNNPISGGDCCD